MSPVSDSRWALIAEHFDRIVELDGEDQLAALAQLTARDPGLAHEVRAMVEADASAQGVLERREEVLSPVAAEATPEFGPQWTALRLLGRGGMGEVWLANRNHVDVVQIAAIKLLKRGMDSQSLLQRFLQERRILARLDHPAIASLLDAGIAPDGRPFLAMDYIRGEPLTTYIRRHSYGLEARLALIAEVARAVDYAHRQLIVHRDLKPGNVLVDDDGRPHLLDFGIAKVLQDNTDEITLTATGVRVLSPSYAAPEQFRGEEVGITADVFALGVLLYEILVGRLPHRRHGRLELFAQENTVERATRPSVAANEVDSAGTATLYDERVGWSKRLRGDLDTLILKAIHPLPERRYGSAALLAEDIDRFLSGRPIRARPDSRGYRLAKFIKRHRVGVLASTLALLSLLIGFGVALWQAQRAGVLAEEALQARNRAQSEYARSEATKDFLLRSLDLAGMRSMSGKLSVDDLLVTMADRIDTEMGAYPSSQGELRVVLGQSLVELGQVERGLALAERGREQLATLHPEPTPLLAVVLNKVGVLRRRAGDLIGAEAAMRASMTMLDALPGDHRLQRIQNRTVLDHILALRGRWGESLANTQARLNERRDILGDDAPELAVDYNNLGVALGRMDRYAEALTAYDRCMVLLSLGGHADSARMGAVERGRALVLMRLGQIDAAQAALDRAQTLRLRHLPVAHADHADTRLAQIGLLRARGRLAEAYIAVQTLLADAQDSDRRLGEWLYERGRIAFAQQKWGVAKHSFSEAATRLQQQAGGDSASSIFARAAAAFASFSESGDAEAVDKELAEAGLAFQQLGLSAIDESADVQLMRAQIAHSRQRDVDAAAFHTSALRTYAQLGLAPPPQLVDGLALGGIPATDRATSSFQPPAD